MIARLVWIVGLVLVAVIAAQLQFDRQVLRDADAAEWVTRPFRGNAQEQIVLEALRGNDPALDLDETRALVQRRPVPAKNLTLLAQAYLKAGEGNAAALAVQIGAQRGWREPIAQKAMARLALNAGDLPEATRRFVALMLLGKQNDTLLSESSEGVFADEDSPGYETLSAIIAETDRWPQLFLRPGPTVMTPRAFAKVLLDTTERGRALRLRPVHQNDIRHHPQRPRGRRSHRGDEGSALPVTPRRHRVGL